jgi:hypothetical protein
VRHAACRGAVDHLEFHAGQRLGEALVHTEADRDVVARITPNVQLVG